MCILSGAEDKETPSCRSYLVPVAAPGTARFSSEGPSEAVRGERFAEVEINSTPACMLAPPPVAVTIPATGG